MSAPPPPFQIGDIIRQKPPVVVLGAGTPEQVVYDSDAPTHVATVTDIHDEGFDYVYPCLVPWISRWGLAFKGGTCLPDGYSQWIPATQAELDAFEASLSHVVMTQSITTTAPDARA